MAEANAALENDLLAELQGLPDKKTGKPSNPISDLPGASAEVKLGPEANPALYAPPAEDPLEVKDPAQASAVAKADKTHAIKAGGKGYKVMVRGDYYVPAHGTTNKKALKRYELTFILPSAERALVVIVKNLLLPALQKLDPNAINYRTHELVDVIPIGGAAPVRHLALMDRAGLEAYVVSHDAPIDPAQYAEVTHLRDAVIDFTQNPKGFEAREAARLAERAELAELRRLNEGIL